MLLHFDRKRYPATWLALGCSEADVQRSILDYLHARRIFAVAVDAGAKTLRRGEATVQGSATVAGFPDICGVLPQGRALFVECKRPAWIINGKVERPAGRLSDAQAEFLRVAAQAGAVALVAWSVSDVQEAVR